VNKANTATQPQTAEIDAPHPSRLRLLLFAFGDFAFNLYWQSVMLFLLFYYTDAIDLPIAVAAGIYTAASIWDGVANFTAGILVDRRQGSLRFGALVAAGAVPLGLLFALAYTPPVASGAWGIAGILIAHLLFRTAYAAVNVPYLAMSARITPDSGDRAFVAGFRMLFGTGAAVAVALGTVPLGQWLTGSSGPRIFLAAAFTFALTATVILILVGVTYRDQSRPERPPAADLRATLLSLARNRAFVALNAAMLTMIVAVTILGKSVLYYFKYVLSDFEAGQVALASVNAVGAIAILCWMFASRYFGLRTLWLVATTFAILGLATFAATDVRTPVAMQVFLICMQVVIVGLHFTFWAMLPNTIEFGERETGLHIEGAVFGVAALLQRIAIGIATAILGWTYASSGYVANAAQSAEMLTSMRATVAIVPLFFLALSALAMLFNPIGRLTRRVADAA
jgi:GPH family glycoside/pentoside/hexuronide:cation symporter